MCEKAAARCEEGDTCLLAGLTDLCFSSGPHEPLRCVISQPMVRTMGGVLMAPLLTETLHKERSVDQCQAILAHLSTVGSNQKTKWGQQFNLHTLMWL